MDFFNADMPDCQEIDAFVQDNTDYTFPPEACNIMMNSEGEPDATMMADVMNWMGITTEEEFHQVKMMIDDWMFGAERFEDDMGGAPSCQEMDAWARDNTSYVISPEACDLVMQFDPEYPDSSIQGEIMNEMGITDD